MNLSIIIPNYNGEKLLQRNLPKVLEAVKGYKDGNVEIIIPDDPSSDNSKKVIKDFIASLDKSNIIGKTIENRNMIEAGFSKNVNRGVKIATGDILILFNSDVSPHINFLSPLLKHFDDEQVFAVSCMDESHENGKTVLRGRGVGNFDRGFLYHKRGEVDKKNTLWVSGGSGAFRKEVWEKLRGFDPQYDPFYWEDIDLSYRAQKCGYKTVFEPASVVVHEHEKGTVMSMFGNMYVKKIAYRNQFIFVWKNITESSLIISHILWLPFHFVKALFNGDWMLFAGFYLALIRLPKIRQSGKFMKMYFVKTDTDIFKDYKN